MAEPGEHRRGRAQGGCATRGPPSSPGRAGGTRGPARSPPAGERCTGPADRRTCRPARPTPPGAPARATTAPSRSRRAGARGRRAVPRRRGGSAPRSRLPSGSNGSVSRKPRTSMAASSGCLVSAKRDRDEGAVAGPDVLPPVRRSSQHRAVGAHQLAEVGQRHLRHALPRVPAPGPCRCRATPQLPRRAAAPARVPGSARQVEGVMRTGSTAELGGAEGQRAGAHDARQRRPRLPPPSPLAAPRTTRRRPGQSARRGPDYGLGQSEGA